MANGNMACSNWFLLSKDLLAASMISFKIYGANDISSEATIVIIKISSMAILCLLRKNQINADRDFGIIYNL